MKSALQLSVWPVATALGSDLATNRVLKNGAGRYRSRFSFSY
jgi:hypothetical protein